MQPAIKAQESAKAWVRRYDWLQYHFPDDEAREYADEMTEVAEGRKRETERPPHEIRREMKILMKIEGVVQFTRAVAVVAVFLGLPILLLQFLSLDGDTLSERVARPALVLACWILAGVIGYRRLWNEWLNVLRRRRLECFWEWRSATFRFPTSSMIDSMSSDKSELPPEASKLENKPPYSPN